MQSKVENDYQESSDCGEDNGDEVEDDFYDYVVDPINNN
jgi:hypothetical protein